MKTRVGEETVGARFWEAAGFVNGVWLTRAQALWVRASKSTNLAFRRASHIMLHLICCLSSVLAPANKPLTLAVVGQLETGGGMGTAADGVCADSEVGHAG